MTIGLREVYETFSLLGFVLLCIAPFFVRVVKAGYVVPLQNFITGAYTRTLVRPGINFSFCEVALQPHWCTSQQDFISHQKTTHGASIDAGVPTIAPTLTSPGTVTRPTTIPFETQIDVPAFSVPLKGSEGCASIDVSLLITIKHPDLVFQNTSRNVPHLVVQEAVVVISNTIANGTDSPWTSTYADFASRVTKLLNSQVANKYGVEAVIRVQSFDVAQRDSATATAYLLRGTEYASSHYANHPLFYAHHPLPYGLRTSSTSSTGVAIPTAMMRTTTTPPPSSSSTSSA